MAGARGNGAVRDHRMDVVANLERVRNRIADAGGDPDRVRMLAVTKGHGVEAVRAALAADRIGTGVHYPTPCHLLAPYRKFATGPLPVAEAAARRIVSLPLSPHMTVDDVVAVCEALRSAVAVREYVHG